YRPGEPGAFQTPPDLCWRQRQWHLCFLSPRFSGLCLVTLEDLIWF
ncbi:hypothetical protein LEMLEM_LOCUS16920, partial [Lemmus lemmus]